ncbi:MAG: hypothetical protein JKY56_14950 [Kofleriaceae bacterium]|nr:hypothetical protein [Kofleriaceae bacterium]
MSCTGDEAPTLSIEELGEKLFFDKNLSKMRTQACASCHDPDHGFIDFRDSTVGKSVSLGDDGVSLGDRNTPTITYAQFSPEFRLHRGEYVGGQFWDGRESDLQGQAKGPFLNPVEMNMADMASVIERVTEEDEYVRAFIKHYGNDIFDDAELAYAKLAESIASFERTSVFSPFDSKYDLSLRGEYILTDQEELGQTLFFSQQFTNCNGCHQLKAIGGSAEETFSDYKYYNLGVPIHSSVRIANDNNGHGDNEYTDHGLLGNPAVDDEMEDGKFRVSTLRNVAITGPYMHNGVFQKLRTVLLFYDKFNNPERLLNPETGLPWRDPEVPVNLALDTEDFKSVSLDDDEIDALLAFLLILTDQRYEALIPEP